MISIYRLNKKMPGSKSLRDTILESVVETVAEVVRSFDKSEEYYRQLAYEGVMAAEAVLDSIADDQTHRYLFNVEINARVAMILWLLDNSGVTQEEIEAGL